MGMVIYDNGRVSVKRFYGGAERGPCFQITTSNGGAVGPWYFVQITASEMDEIIKAIKEGNEDE